MTYTQNHRSDSDEYDRQEEFVKTEKHKRRVAVIGAGASGLVAAGSAALCGADVTVFEWQNKTAKKLRITGKGRCNLTNDCDIQEFLKNVPRNSKFLYSALNRLPPKETISLFESLSLPLKTERGRRVFPQSDRASDVVRALEKYAFSGGLGGSGVLGAKLIRERVDSLIYDSGGVVGLSTALGREYRPFDAVIICTGGLSYPATGSVGDGYRLARSVGHTVTSLTPSLVPIEARGSVCKELCGLSLKNVSLKIIEKRTGKKIFEDFGELLFTHFGLSGPMILSASAHISDVDISDCYASIDLKPALDEKQLDRRVLSDFSEYANKDFINSLSDLLPAKMILPFAQISKIDPRKKVNTITKEERKTVISLLKNFKIELLKLRPIQEAVITSGGVDIREINPKTMESKRLCGLYFAGEVIDVDAYTGGYNLQIAFSTGMLAGECAARKDTL